jgi:asparagine synthase (glutamine-hydrolysing)
MGLLAGVYDPLGGAAWRRMRVDQMLARHSEPGLLMGVAPEPSHGGAQGNQRFRSEHGNAVDWDGCLHNRADVIAKLGDSAADLEADGAVALALYEKAGDAGLGSLIGDWSLAIWDAQARAITLASDFAGVRPLYYYASGGAVAGCSSLRILARWTSTVELDDDYIVEILVRGASACRTPYCGIRAVPPGVALRFVLGRMSTTTFWRLNPGIRVRYTDERMYAERLYMLFEEAVRVRMPAASPAHAELSGGLDSSSIVCMARRLMAEDRVSSTKLTAVRYCDPGSRDERFARLVMQECGLESEDLDVRDYPFVTAESPGDSAPSWWTSRNAELGRRMTAAGSTTLFTGRTGDLLMGNWHDESDRVADLLRQGALGRACVEAHDWSRALGLPVYRILWRAFRLNVPFLCPPTQSAAALPRYNEDSLSDRARKRAAQLLASQSDLTWREAPVARRRHFRMVAEILATRTLEVPELLFPIFYTHPFVHRPLVEYMLAIPDEIVCGIGEPRRLMRRAFAGLLPRAVLRRKSKASFHSVFSNAIRPLAAELAERPMRSVLVARGFVDARQLEVRLRRFLNGLDSNEAQLRQLILVEFWLRAQFSAGRSGHLHQRQRASAGPLPPLKTGTQK